MGDDAVRRLRVPVEFSYLSPRVLPPPTEKRECCPSECALTSSFHILEIFCFLPIGNFVLYIEYLLECKLPDKLGSIDVGDAYLMVEQEEPTVVEVDGEYYELGFTLPGQRIGSSAWFNKLKGYLEEYGMTSDNGLPALFSKMPSKNGKGILLLTHVDDMELYAAKEDFEKLVELVCGLVHFCFAVRKVCPKMLLFCCSNTSGIFPSCLGCLHALAWVLFSVHLCLLGSSTAARCFSLSILVPR